MKRKYSVSRDNFYELKWRFKYISELIQQIKFFNIIIDLVAVIQNVSELSENGYAVNW